MSHTLDTTYWQCSLERNQAISWKIQGKQEIKTTSSSCLPSDSFQAPSSCTKSNSMCKSMQEC